MKTRDELIKAFDYSNGFATETVKEIQANPQEYSPVLIDILECLAQNPQLVEDDENFMAHLYTFFLLGELKAKEAFPALLKLCQLDDEEQEIVFGDFSTGELNALLAVTCPDLQLLIDDIILNDAGNEWVRGAAVNAFYVLFWEGKITREQLVAYYLQIFGKLQAEGQYNVWSCLVSNCCEICPLESEAQCRKAFAEGRVDTLYVREEDIDKRLEMGVDKCVEEGRENQQLFIVDTVEELGGWVCFENNEANEQKEAEMASRLTSYIKTGSFNTKNS